MYWHPLIASDLARHIHEERLRAAAQARLARAAAASGSGPPFASLRAALAALFRRAQRTPRSPTARPGHARAWAGRAAVGVLISAVILGAGRLPAAAAGPDRLSPHAAGITVVGDGSVLVRPDQVTLRVAVEATAPGAAAALRESQQTAERVLQRLRELGVPETDLHTTGPHIFTVEGPFTRDGMPAPGQPPASYRGRIGITARVQDLSDPARAAHLLEAAVQAGANVVLGIAFSVRDAPSLERQALEAALRDARPKAEAVASAAGLPLGPVRAVVQEPLGSPGPKGGFGGSDGVMPGQSEIVVRALVSFDTGPASAAPPAQAPAAAPTPPT